MVLEPKIRKNGSKVNAYNFLHQSQGVTQSDLFGHKTLFIKN